MAKLNKPIDMSKVPSAGSQRNVDTGKASPNPAKAETRANLKTTFGTPKKQ